MLEVITSRENNNIKNLVKLMSSKKERKEQNSFVIEGVRLLKDAIKSNIIIKQLFFTDEIYTKHKAEIDTFINNSNNCFILSSYLSDKISDTNTPQGVYAICEILDNQFDADKICINGRYIILNSLQDPGNVGTIIRSCEAFGITALILSADCPDIYSPKVLRGAMGGVFRLPVYAVSDILEFIDGIKSKGVKTYAAVLDGNAKNICDIDLQGSIAIVIGNEGNGLPENIVKVCDETAIIPMKSDAESLNASVCASIIAWEITKK